MAVDFGEGNINKYYVVTADTSLDLPDGDWCVGWWYRIEDNAGSGFHFPFSWGGLDGNNSFNAYMAEDSQGDPTRVRNFVLDILDVGYNRFEDQGNWLAGDANDINIGDNELVIFQRAGDTCYIYTAPVGGAPTEQGQDTNALFTTCSLSTDLYIGAYQGLTTAWFHDEHMGEVFLMHDSLSTEEIAAIAGGVPVGQLNKDLRMWLDFKEAAATFVDLSGNGNDATRNGSPVTSEHFPVKHNKPNLVIVSAAAGGAYTLTAEGGTYTESGTAASLEHRRTLSAESGSYSEAGTAADLEYGRKIAADPAAYLYTGQAASLEHDRKLAAEAGVYVEAGQDASLEHGRVVAAEAGSYAESGQDASLEYGRKLSAESGTFIETGQDATLIHDTPNVILTAEAGTFVLDGSPATLLVTGIEEPAEEPAGVGGQLKPVAKPRRKTKKEMEPALRLDDIKPVKEMEPAEKIEPVIEQRKAIPEEQPAIAEGPTRLAPQPEVVTLKEEKPLVVKGALSIEPVLDIKPEITELELDVETEMFLLLLMVA